VGVGTWRTQAEFADIRVNGEPIDLKPVSGSWERTSEQNWRQTDLADDRRALGGSLTARNYTLTLKAKKISGAEGFLILFYVRSTGDFLWWNIGGWGNNRHNIELAVGGGKSNITRDVPGRIEEGRWYDIKIVCEGRRVQCYLDNTRVHDAQIPPPANDLAAVSTRDKNGDLLVKVVNMGKEARPTKIHLKNAPRLTGTGTVTVLTSTDPMDENSFENPKRIVPTTQALTKITADFTYTVPAYSVSILRLPVQ
jgi:alpha-L-arabinofuranosidase